MKHNLFCPKSRPRNLIRGKKVCLGVDKAAHSCLILQYGKKDKVTVLVSSSPPPIPLRVRYIPVMLHFTLLVRAVTAAHHYGTAWANFNGCHRQQEKMLACQRKQWPGAKKDGLPPRRVKWQQWHLSWGLTKISFKVITQAKHTHNLSSKGTKSV